MGSRWKFPCRGETYRASELIISSDLKVALISVIAHFDNGMRASIETVKHNIRSIKMCSVIYGHLHEGHSAVDILHWLIHTYESNVMNPYNFARGNIKLCGRKVSIRAGRKAVRKSHVACLSLLTISSRNETAFTWKWIIIVLFDLHKLFS